MTSETTQIRGLDEELLAVMKKRFETVSGQRGPDGSIIGRSFAELEALTNTWKSAQSRIDSYLARQKTLHNREIPHQLPQEILATVFWIAAYDSDFKGARDGTPWYYRQLRIFMMVSTGWRSLIVQTPSLWAVYGAGYPSGLRRQIVARSSQHPLDVRIDTKPRPRSAVQRSDLAEDFVVSVPKWRDRLRRADIAIGPEDIDQFAALLASPLPQLEALNLLVSSSMWNEWITGLDLSNKPKLRELSLGGFAVDWNQVDFPNLETLHLQDIGNAQENLLSLRYFLESLQNSPGLKSLVLTDVDVTDDLQDSDPLSSPCR